ncbi:coiled-coil domain-containing protein 42 homolog isoform X1 [Siniperca chuatsi]|uniref:coiled-coil domain-containing protein 42 homolog isoform X1 n=1 Tax=Siniperca chuatsi TaxID=119488 RepID=UPI001CE1BD0C|nr:coiled-coil domain-containing protein 42 homolog isoform X1 [Siniperca chuatsi]
MDSRAVRKEQVSQGLPAGASGVMTGNVLSDWSVAFFDLQKKRREEEELNAKTEERKQLLESLQQRIDELHMEVKVKTEEELYSSFDLFRKKEDANQAAEKAERDREEGLQKEAEIKRLKEEYAEMMERKQEVERQVQRHTVYRDFMECVVKMTKFEDVQLLTGHLESLLHFRDQFYRRESEAQEQADQQRKALLTLEDQHHLLRLHKNNQLSQLQTELEKTRSEAQTWERKWNHIQETAAKKTLLLGQIKMATLNLYEMTEDMIEGEEGVDMNDTEKQLDMVKMFIQDHDDIVRQHQTPSQRHNNGQKREKAKKRIVTCIKKCNKH